MPYRPANKDDVGFVIHSWLESFKENLEYSMWVIVENWRDTQRKPKIDKHLLDANYFYWAEPLIKSVLSRSKVLISHNPEDPTHILGYIVFSLLPDTTPVLHWAYTRAALRKIGIAKNLINIIRVENKPLLTTFITKDFIDLQAKIPHEFSKPLLEKILHD